MLDEVEMLKIEKQSVTDQLEKIKYKFTKKEMEYNNLNERYLKDFYENESKNKQIEILK